MATAALISRFRAEYAARALAYVAVRGAWVLLGAALLLIALDALFAFNGWVRFMLMVAALGALAVVVFASHYRLHRSPSYDRMMARLVEEGDPALENVLINALDFEDAIQTGRNPASAPDLMEAEIRRAETQSSSVQEVPTLTPPGYARERRTFLVMLALTVLAIVVFWRVFVAVVPRFLLPFADFPPYSPTVLAVDPGAIEIDYGENLKVNVTASRVIPKSVDLVIWNRDGRELAALPMFHAGDGNFFQTIENVRDDVRYFARIPDGRSRRYPIDVNKQPRVEEVVATFVYPAYTRRDSETRVVADNVLRGYVDTRIAMTVRSNRPLSHGSLTVDGKEHAFKPAEDGAILGEFTIAKAGSFAISISDAEGNTASDAVKGAIEIIPDTRPEVFIAAPGMDSFALPNAKVPIEIEATDDIAISEVAVVRNHNSSEDARKVLYNMDDGMNALSVTEVLDLGKLGVRPGDLIEYYATASDNYPPGKQTAASPAFALRIISEEEYRDFMQTRMTAEDLTKKYENILEALTELTEAQKQLREQTEALENARESGGEPSDAGALQQQQEAQAALSQAAQELAGRLDQEAETPGIFDIESDYKEALREFAERLQQASEHMQNASQSMQSAAQQPSQSQQSQNLPEAIREQTRALEQLAQNVEEFQQGIQAANENLENVVNVMADTEEFKYLYTLQKGLERQIRYYRERENPTLDEQIRLKELSERQAEVLQALSELKDKFRAHAEELDALAEKQLQEVAP